MNESEDIRSFIAEAQDAGKRIDAFLAEKSGFSRTKVSRCIEQGCVKVNDCAALKPSRPVCDGDEAVISPPRTEEPRFAPENIPLDIVYEDERLLVVNKPAGMVVHPGIGASTGTLAAALLYHCRTISSRGGAFRPGIVHRLDRDTSGLLAIALDDETHERLSLMISERKITRIYMAFVWGRPDPESGEIDAPIGRHPRIRTLNAVVPGGRRALTRYETIARYRFLSRLRVTLGTGRTHQIRVHLAHIGHHVFGDPCYGGREERLKGFDSEIRNRARALLRLLPRQALHAGRLEFRHPFTGEFLTFQATLPDDLARLLEALDHESDPRGQEGFPCPIPSISS
jgi:23S rRNA pseudouridine1911/1915/1917 synthase